MMRTVLTGMLAVLVCGCLSRSGTDLLQARIRDQEVHLADAERQVATTQTELAKARREADGLRTELAKRGSGGTTAEQTEALVRVTKLQIHSLLSGGINKDEQPGDDAFVAQLAPVDVDGEVVKLPGQIELTLLDPAVTEGQREVGRWNFTVEECRQHWTRGLTGAGYQFTVPLAASPTHDSLVLHAKLTTVDGRSFDASQIVRVSPGTTITASSRREVLGRSVLDRSLLDRPALDTVPRELDDINDPPPAPLKDQPEELPAWADPAATPARPAGTTPPAAPTKAGAKTPAELPAPGLFPPAPKKREVPPLRDSTNWTEGTIPQLR